MRGLPPLQVSIGQLACAAVLDRAVRARAAARRAPVGRSRSLAVAALGALGSGIAYLLYFALIASAGASRAILVTYLVPAFALVYGARLPRRGGHGLGARRPGAHPRRAPPLATGARSRRAGSRGRGEPLLAAAPPARRRSGARRTSSSRSPSRAASSRRRSCAARALIAAARAVRVPRRHDRGGVARSRELRASWRAVRPCSARRERASRSGSSPGARSTSTRASRRSRRRRCRSSRSCSACASCRTSRSARAGGRRLRRARRRRRPGRRSPGGRLVGGRRHACRRALVALLRLGGTSSASAASGRRPGPVLATGPMLAGGRDARCRSRSSSCPRATPDGDALLSLLALALLGTALAQLLLYRADRLFGGRRREPRHLPDARLRARLRRASSSTSRSRLAALGGLALILAGRRARIGRAEARAPRRPRLRPDAGERLRSGAPSDDVAVPRRPLPARGRRAVPRRRRGRRSERRSPRRSSARSAEPDAYGVLVLEVDGARSAR